MSTERSGVVKSSLATLDVVGHSKEDVGGGRIVKVEYILKVRITVTQDQQYRDGVASWDNGSVGFILKVELPPFSPPAPSHP